MNEVEQLKEDAKALRLKVYDLTSQLESARQLVTNTALEGPGHYVFSEDGEGNKFGSQREAWLHQLKLQEEGMTSVRVVVQERIQGAEQSEPYECPQRPSHDPQDVRNAE